jgi:glutathione S-transferase
MWRLYQFPLCPFSRKVRLQLAEKGVGYDLVRELPWEQQDAFLDLNPAGTTPVMVDDDKGAVLIDSQAICEYFEETVEKMPLISGSPTTRAEIRRLTAWIDQIFYRDVVAPLLEERMRKRIVHRAPPDGGRLREAMRNANTHMDYMDYLLDHRSWLAGGHDEPGGHRGGGAYFGRGLSRRHRLGRARAGQALVCGVQVPPLVPAAAVGADGSDRASSLL